MSAKLTFVGKVVLDVVPGATNMAETRLRVSDRAQAAIIRRLFDAGCFGCLSHRKVLLEVDLNKASDTLTPLTVRLLEKAVGKRGTVVSGPAQAALAANERGEDPSVALTNYWEKQILASEKK